MARLTENIFEQHQPSFVEAVIVDCPTGESPDYDNDTACVEVFGKVLKDVPIFYHCEANPSSHGRRLEGGATAFELNDHVILSTNPLAIVGFADGSLRLCSRKLPFILFRVLDGTDKDRKHVCMFYDIQKKETFIPSFLDGGALGFAKAFYYEDLDARQAWWFGNLFPHYTKQVWKYYPSLGGTFPDTWHYIGGGIYGQVFHLSNLGRIPYEQIMEIYKPHYLFVGSYNSSGEINENGVGNCSSTFIFDKTSQEVKLKVGSTEETVNVSLSGSSPTFTYSKIDDDDFKETKWKESYDTKVLDVGSAHFRGDYISSVAISHFSVFKEEEISSSYEWVEDEDDDESGHWELVSMYLHGESDQSFKVTFPEINTKLGVLPERVFEYEDVPLDYSGNSSSDYYKAKRKSGYPSFNFKWVVTDEWKNCTSSVKPPEDPECTVWDDFNWNMQLDTVYCEESSSGFKTGRSVWHNAVPDEPTDYWYKTSEETKYSFPAYFQSRGYVDMGNKIVYEDERFSYPHLSHKDLFKSCRMRFSSMYGVLSKEIYLGRLNIILSVHSYVTRPGYGSDEETESDSFCTFLFGISESGKSDYVNTHNFQIPEFEELCVAADGLYSWTKPPGKPKENAEYQPPITAVYFFYGEPESVVFEKMPPHDSSIPTYCFNFSSYPYDESERENEACIVRWPDRQNYSE